LKIGYDLTQLPQWVWWPLLRKKCTYKCV